MSLGIWQIVLVLVLVVLLFGRGKISELMGDVAKGITSFRKGLAEGTDDSSTTTNSANQSDATTAPKATVIDNETGQPVEKDPATKE